MGVLDVVGRLEVAWTLTFVLILLPLPMRAALVRPCYECDDLDVALALQRRRARPLAESDGGGAPLRSSDGTPAGAAGYNCSHPLRGVVALDGDAAAAAAFEETARRPPCSHAPAAARSAPPPPTTPPPTPPPTARRRGAAPRTTTPTASALYPECVRATGCERGASYDATTAHLEAACAAPYGGDYPAEWAYNRSTTAGYDWQTGYGAAGDGSYAPPAGGRALPAASCLGYAEFGQAGLFRALLLGANFVVLPFVACSSSAPRWWMRLPPQGDAPAQQAAPEDGGDAKAEIRRMNGRGGVHHQAAGAPHARRRLRSGAGVRSAAAAARPRNAADAAVATKLAARKGKGAAAAAGGAAAADGSESGGAAADSSSSASPALAAAASRRRRRVPRRGRRLARSERRGRRRGGGGAAEPPARRLVAAGGGRVARPADRGPLLSRRNPSGQPRPPPPPIPVPVPPVRPRGSPLAPPRRAAPTRRLLAAIHLHAQTISRMKLRGEGTGRGRQHGGGRGG